MFGLQPVHLAIILFIALLLFAPSRLPDLGRAVRKTIDEFRAGVQEPASSARPTSSDARKQETTAIKK